MINSTSLSHDDTEVELTYLSFAFSTSVEPQRNLLPYIKAFDSSIMGAHIRYCIPPHTYIQFS